MGPGGWWALAQGPPAGGTPRGVCWIWGTPGFLGSQSQSRFRGLGRFFKVWSLVATASARWWTNQTLAALSALGDALRVPVVGVQDSVGSQDWGTGSDGPGWLVKVWGFSRPAGCGASMVGGEAVGWVCGGGMAPGKFCARCGLAANACANHGPKCSTRVLKLKGWEVPGCGVVS